SRIGNESMAQLVQDYPDRFAGFCAVVPMDDPEAAVEEYNYARFFMCTARQWMPRNLIHFMRQ
ncbi:MAG: hypothetical protein M1288_03070, partial [Actinobacteria bacterium]|nr:hypothetical protein [Actinomycetota bacterium]